MYNTSTKPKDTCINNFQRTVVLYMANYYPYSIGAAYEWYLL